MSTPLSNCKMPDHWVMLPVVVSEYANSAFISFSAAGLFNPSGEVLFHSCAALTSLVTR